MQRSQSKGMSKKTKKLIFCSYSCVYSSLVLNKILEDKNIDVVAIVNSSRILKPNYGALRGSLEQIRLSGWRYSTYLFLITDVFHWLQFLLKYRKQSLNTIHGIAKQHDIPIINSKDINDKESLAFVCKQDADVLLAAHFNQLVKPAILNIQGLECLNLHPSLLPAFKGVDPVFYALLQKKGGMGISLHKMAESFDTGAVLSQWEYSLQYRHGVNNNCLFSINCELFSKGAELAVSWINKDSQDPHSQILSCISLVATSSTTPNTGAETKSKSSDQYDSWPNVEKIKEFSKLGNKLMCLAAYLSLIFSGKKR